MIGYLGFDDALDRLLAVAYGERAMQTVSSYKAPDGELHLVYRAPDGEVHLDPPELPPDFCLTKEEYWAAKAAFVQSLRCGDNVGIVMVDGTPQRLPLWHSYTPPYWTDPPPETRPDRDEGRPT